MRKVILAAILAVGAVWAAISDLTLPQENIAAGTPPQVGWVDQNFDSVKVRLNQVKDTLNALQAGTAAFSGLTASLPVFTNASKRPVSNAMTGTGSVVMSSGATLTNPTITGINSLSLSGNLAADSIVSPKFYEENTFTCALTGFSSTVNGTCRYVRIGKQVTLFIPAMNGASNSTSMALTGLPTAIQPARNKVIRGLQAQDDAGQFLSAFQFDTGSPTQFSVLIKTAIGGQWGTSSFTASGTKGLFFAQDITYTTL